MVKVFQRAPRQPFTTAPLPPLISESGVEILVPVTLSTKAECTVEVVMDWKRLLAYISGSVDQELLLRNEYLVTENQILRNQLKGRLRLTDGERKTLAEIGKRLGKKALEEIASIVKPETILAWHRRLVAKKFDGSKNRKYPGRPRMTRKSKS